MVKCFLKNMNQIVKKQKNNSYRGRGKEVLKAYQENSNLAEFAKVLGKPDSPIETADETALFQIINQLNPLVIVDESHRSIFKKYRAFLIISMRFWWV